MIFLVDELLNGKLNYFIYNSKIIYIMQNKYIKYKHKIFRYKNIIKRR